MGLLDERPSAGGLLSGPAPETYGGLLSGLGRAPSAFYNALLRVAQTGLQTQANMMGRPAYGVPPVNPGVPSSAEGVPLSGLPFYAPPGRDSRLNELAHYVEQGLLGGGPGTVTSGVRLPRLSSAAAAEPAATAAERAAAAGFRPMDWYHGTAGDIAAFDAGKAGSVTGSPVPGFSFTRSPELASDFAELAGRAGGDAAPNVIKARLAWKNAGLYDAKGGQLTPHEIAGALQDAAAGGHDALILRNVSMAVEGKPARVSDVAIALKPEQIRSVFAAFDPAKAGSGDLLASLAGAGLLVGLGASHGEGAE